MQIIVVTIFYKIFFRKSKLHTRLYFKSNLCSVIKDWLPEFIKNYLSLTKDQTFQCFFLLPFNYLFNYFSFSLAISTLRLKPLLDFVIVCAVICIQLKLGLWCCHLSNCLKFHSYSWHSQNINA